MQNSTLENISNTDLLYITEYVEKNYSSVTSGKSDTLGGISIKNPGNEFELISYSATSSWAWAVVNCVKSTDIYYNAYVYFINTYSASINIRATIHTLWKRKFLQPGS